MLLSLLSRYKSILVPRFFFVEHDPFFQALVDACIGDALTAVLVNLLRRGDDGVLSAVNDSFTAGDIHGQMRIQASVLVDVGRPIVMATYALEGDGFLSAVAYDYLLKVEDTLLSDGALKVTEALVMKMVEDDPFYTQGNLWVIMAILLRLPKL